MKLKDAYVKSIWVTTARSIELILLSQFGLDGAKSAMDYWREKIYGDL